MIESWSDGNPYFINELGEKQYAYHPDHENLSRCIGNDSPYLCLECGNHFKVDSREPASECPKCGAKHTRDVCDLEGQRCPSCKKGQFGIDPDYLCIS